MISFYEYVIQFKEEPSPIGRVGKFLSQCKEFPRELESKKELSGFLRRAGVDSQLREQINFVWKMYTSNIDGEIQNEL